MGMTDSIVRWLTNVKDERSREGIRVPLSAIGDRLSSCMTQSAGLIIKAGGGVLAKTSSLTVSGICSGIVQGVPVSIAASTDMPALTGLTITANSFNVACFFIDTASTVTAAFGTEGTTLALVKFPPFPVGKALVGYLIITHSSTFTGNSTALDAATTIYCSPTGAIDPSVLL